MQNIYRFMTVAKKSSYGLSYLLLQFMPSIIIIIIIIIIIRSYDNDNNNDDKLGVLYC